MISSPLPVTHADVADHYDELDPIYRRFWGDHVHHGFWEAGVRSPEEAVAALSDAVAVRLGLRPGSALVDIGCGYGATARRFAAQGARVTGFTLSAAQIMAAPAARNVSLRCADWLANGLGDASFDGAYAIESSEHMVDKSLFFAEARRVLKRGGRLVICAWLAAEAPRQWEIRHLLEPICSEGRMPSLATETEYRAMAEAAGFECLASENLSASVARTWRICLARFARALMSDRELARFAIRARNRSFALSLPRLILAYGSGALRYGLMTFKVPVSAR